MLIATCSPACANCATSAWCDHNCEIPDPCTAASTGGDTQAGHSAYVGSRAGRCSTCTTLPPGQAAATSDSKVIGSLTGPR